MTIRAGFLAVVGCALLAACQSTGSAPPAPTTAETIALSRGLSEAIGRCWFGEGEEAFTGYAYTPENAGGRPRILLVSHDDPTGRPVLVLQPLSGSEVEVYGPLLEAEVGPRIRADIDRWRSGGTACGS